jgi:hypothetical protein
VSLQRGDPGLVLGDDGGLRLLAAEFAAVVLGQPELQQVGGQVVVPGRITAADGTAADVLAQLKPELWRMAPVGAS